MRQFWLRVWLALAVAAGLLLPVRPGVLQTLGGEELLRVVEDAGHPSTRDAGKPEPGTQHEGARLQKGRSHEGGGAPPREAFPGLPALAWLGMSPAASVRGGILHASRAVGFLPQGMQPEQGGLNGPPAMLV